MLKTTLILFLVTFLTTQAVAQDNTTVISGKITDSQGSVLPYVTVSIISLPDSSATKKMFTNESGIYSFDGLKHGSYVIQAEGVGFTANSIGIDIKKDQKEQIIDDISLSVNNNELNTVTITSKKPLFERKADMMVVNVEDSPLAAGNNALEILERSPGITVDKDDNISLNGKQGVTVMINGKPTHLSANQLASLLRSTDGNTIQSVEIINSPSSKYDAAGGPGIINIKLKKNKTSGTSGAINAGAGYGNAGKVNSSLNLNHKTGGISLFGTYSYQGGEKTDLMDIYRLVGEGTNYTSFMQGNSMNSTYKNHSLRTGMDIETSARNTVSIQVNGSLNRSDNNNRSGVTIGSHNSALDSSLVANSLFDEDFTSASINLNNTFLIDTMGRKLSVDADFSTFREDAGAHYENLFYGGDGSTSNPPLLLRSNMPSKIFIHSYKADYSHPINEKTTIAAGMKFASVKTDNDLEFNEWIDESWHEVNNRSNHFIYKEQVAALYAILNKSINKVSVQAGLRTEYTLSDGNSITLNTRVKKDYIDFFPNVSVSYVASDKHKYSFSYAKRINRPRYNNLNPFNYFLDKYTYQQGNPYLEPDYTHAFAVNYNLHNKFNFSVGYEITNNAAVEIMKQNDEEKTTLVTNENIAQQKQSYLNINAPIRLADFWESNTNLTGFYLGFLSKEQHNIDYGQFAVQLSNNHSFTIIPDLRLDATLNYQSSLRYSIYKIGQSWSTDIGINKSFKNKRSSIKLSVSDVFNTRTQQVTTQYANLNASIDQKRETRVIRLSLAWNFGSMKINTPNTDTKSDEEKRVGK